MIRRLARYIKGYEKNALLAPLYAALETIGELILPLLMADILDDGIQAGNLTVVYQKGGWMLLVAAFSLLFGVLGAKHAAYAAQGVGANLRWAQFQKVNEFSFADIDRFSSASLITRMTNDVTNIQNLVVMCLRMLVRSVVMCVTALIMAFYIRAQLAVILLCFIPAIALFVGILMRICHPLFEKFQQAFDNLNHSVQENLIAIRVVKAFVREDHEREKFKTANDGLTAAGLRAVLKMVMQQPIMMVGISAATVLILYYGGLAVLRDPAFEIGQLSSLLTYVSNILFSVMMIAMALLQFTRAQACADRIFEVLDTDPDIQDAPDAAERMLPQAAGRVEFRDVAFKYQKRGTGDMVLEHISFTAEPGQVVAVVGGTGVGKSSLVNLIPRFYDVDEGQVLLDGMDVREYPLEVLRGRIGMVLQNNVLFSGTIRENLMWGRDDATEEEMIQAAKNAQAYDFIMSFPDGFDTVLDQGGVNVSGGQKQRLCIARAMLRKPAVLILDDSTSAVDSATEALIRESFGENLKGTTVILIAQRISSVRDADQIIVLEDGTIAGVGTHDELMENNQIYQDIYWSQQEGVSENG